MLNQKISLILFAAVMLFSLTAYGQQNIRGLIVDAGTREPLPYVTVKIKNRSVGTSSNDLGSFTVQAMLFDTLMFSCIGYSTLEVAVTNPQDQLYIQLEEVTNVLKTITVYNSVTPGFKNIPKESKWQNQAAKNDYGYGILQTFGPGYTIKSPISHFLKSEKEKRKLTEVQKDNSKARGYIEVVNAPDVKDELMKKYALTEQQYYDVLAKFNQTNQRSMYDLDRKSLVHSIFVFFDNDLTGK